jgi:diguanylate cyclase (GGDEF)-like protein
VISRIKKKLRKSDKIGRYGGDEIIIVLPRCSSSEIIRIAERLRISVAKKGIKTELDMVPLTISLGCAASDVTGILSAEGFIKAADEALLKAKNQGRNRMVVTEGFSKTKQEQNNAQS